MCPICAPTETRIPPSECDSTVDPRGGRRVQAVDDVTVKVRAQVRVHLSGPKLPVSHEPLHNHQRLTSHDEVRRKRVPHGLRAAPLYPRDTASSPHSDVKLPREVAEEFPPLHECLALCLRSGLLV